MSFLLSSGLRSAIPDSVVDNFEDILYEDAGKTLSDFYSGDLSNFERQTTTVFNGTYALRCIANGGFYEIDSFSGLQNYPSPGDSFELRMLLDGIDDEDFRFDFGFQDKDNYYSINISPNTGSYRLEKREGGSEGALDSKSMSFNANVWYKVTTSWGTSGSLSTTLEDESGNQLASLSANDSTFTNGGIQFKATAAGGITNDVYWDEVFLI
jgi:hypothetical protein